MNRAVSSIAAVPKANGNMHLYLAYVRSVHHNLRMYNPAPGNAFFTMSKMPANELQGLQVFVGQPGESSLVPILNPAMSFVSVLYQQDDACL